MVMPAWLGSDKVTLGPAQPVAITNMDVLAAWLIAGVIGPYILPEYTGTSRYVSPNGDNSDGLSLDTAYNNLNAAMGDCVPRDVILVEGGYSYDVTDTLNGFVCDVDTILIEAVGERGATLSNTDVTNDGATVHITAEDVTLRNFQIAKGENASLRSAAVRFDGAINCRLDECIVVTGNAATHLGLQFINGAFGCGMVGRDVVYSTIAGYGVGIAADFDNATRCFLAKTGVGLTTTGVRFAGSASLCSVGIECLLQDCVTGYSLEAGATLNMARGEPLRCTVGVINNSGNATNYIGEFGQEHYEHLIPMCDGEGGAIAAASVTTDASDETNGAASSQYFWGEPTAIVVRDLITAPYAFLGLEVASFTAGKSFQWTLYFDRPGYGSDKNAGNAWDEGATDLTVDDGTLYLDGDLVAIYSDYKVEIVRVNGAPVGDVVVIEREASQFGAPNTGLRWNHTTNDPGTERMTVLRRVGILEVVEGHITWEGIYRIHEHMHLNANAFILMRAINLTDGTNAANITLFPMVH